MQIVPKRDNLHEMSKLIFCENKKEIFQTAEIFTQKSKHYADVITNSTNL